MRLKYLAPTGQTFSQDLAELTVDAVDANGFTGNALHFIVDQSQVSSAASIILIEDDGGAYLFRIDDAGSLFASGNVGIGTTDPSALFSLANAFTVNGSGNLYPASISFEKSAVSRSITFRPVASSSRLALELALFCRYSTPRIHDGRRVGLSGPRRTRRRSAGPARSSAGSAR